MTPGSVHPDEAMSGSSSPDRDPGSRGLNRSSVWIRGCKGLGLNRSDAPSRRHTFRWIPLFVPALVDGGCLFSGAGSAKRNGVHEPRLRSVGVRARDRARLHHTCPPMDHERIESPNGKLRDECLNMNWFESLSEARAVSERWRVEYNEMRPHSSLGNRAPAAYAAELLGVGTSSRIS